jgi:hypothetical protein
MSRPIFSIAGLAGVAVAIAVGCAGIQAMYSSASIYADDAVAVLPMAGILMIGLTILAQKLSRRGEHVSFLAGFEASGWAAVLVFVLVIVLSPEVVEGYRQALLVPLYRTVFELGGIIPEGGVHEPARRLCIALVFTIPLLLAALVGGGLSNWMGLSIVMRKPSPREAAAVNSRT